MTAQDNRGTKPAPGRRGAVIQAAGALAELLGSALVTVVVVTIGLYAFSRVQWPAFGSSNVTRALTTLGQVISIVVLGVSLWMWRTGRVWGARLLSWAGLASFVTVTLGMPLAATRLYLFGISVDQEFRTQFLTRLTDSPALSDMNYAGLPSFYPAGWFWIGGRVANVAGLQGWEAFKPYSIGSIAVACVAAFVLWSRLIRADWAVLAAFATTAVLLTYGSPEPYGAIIAVLIPPVLLLAWGGLYRPANGWPVARRSEDRREHRSEERARSGPRTGATTQRGGVAAVVGTGLFLGLAATFYTLYLAVAAFTVTLMAVVAAAIAVRSERNWRAARGPAARLVVIAAIAGVLAAIVWLPYLLELRHNHPAGSGTAFHYLPVSGSQLTLPMFDFSVLGLFCFIGTIWLVLRAGSSRRAQSLALGVAAIYLWTLLSLVATAAGTTLLSFRLESTLLLLLTTAGVFGALEGARAVYQALNEPPRYRLVMIALGTLAAIAFSQNIPNVLKPEIDTAYGDTDGNGARADRRPPSAVSYYRDVDAALAAKFPRERRDTVVLTADTSFLAIYPYRGFQGITSHYANPLADYVGRAGAIADWTKLSSADELNQALATSRWRAPDAFMFRKSGGKYTLRLARDSYPNDPNVKRYSVAFPEKLFDDPAFEKREIGPFVLVTRQA